MRCTTFAAGLCLPGGAWAHAFGARYDLPLPLWLYLTAAGGAVALSFLIMALVLRPGTAPPAEPSTAIVARPGALLSAARILCVGLLVAILTAAFMGADSPTGNLATVFVWIIWWVGLAFVQALIADVWSAINPWRFLAELWEPAPIRGNVADGASPARDDAWRLAYWPAVVLFLLFAWLELVSDLGEQPRRLGVLILAYTAVTLVAARIVGSGRWFTFADPFSVVFGILGRFAPIDMRPGGGLRRLRLPGMGLMVEAAVPLSMVVMVLALLATVSFDGFVETPPWADFLDWVSEDESLRVPLVALQGAGVDLLKLVKTLGLLAAVSIFSAVYLLFAWLVDRCSGDPRGLRESAGRFALTLVPIAIGYHVAHYLSYLLIAGQLIIPLASDPFGLGWDLLGTRNYSLDIAIVDARFVWFTAVATIVAGHVIAVWLAHATALRLYVHRRAALRSQMPMLILMVGYTMTSLWILSQPIVEV
jgi:hypothetical protein